MLRQVEREAENGLFHFLNFLRTVKGGIWLALLLIALFLVFEPDESEVTVHTHFLLVCFACLALVPDFSRDKNSQKTTENN